MNVVRALARTRKIIAAGIAVSFFEAAEQPDHRNF